MAQPQRSPARFRSATCGSRKETRVLKPQPHGHADRRYSSIQCQLHHGDGNATSGSDYVATSGTLSFGSGVTTQTISVTINGDTAVEPDETFLVILSGATNGATASAPSNQAGGNIVNDNSAAVVGSVSINDVTTTEGDVGTKILTFTVARTGGTAAFSVNFATANNSALSGSDYVATAGTLTFAGGGNTQTISVTINSDKTVEADETFFVNLSGATNGATITDSQGQGTITNDDTASSTDDYADSFTDFTAPFGQATVGSTSTGNLETTGDRDWYRVSLTAGVSYMIDLQGIDTSNGTLYDPFVYLYNGSGQLLIQDDDAGVGFNSQLNSMRPLRRVFIILVLPGITTVMRVPTGSL